MQLEKMKEEGTKVTLDSLREEIKIKKKIQILKGDTKKDNNLQIQEDFIDNAG
jgi:hypothetical protein